MELALRKKKILKAIVEDYIQTAEPVGSKALAERLDLGLSPATLRHEMADLEAMGYLEHPHTSAGRIPSHQGYRYYVDVLMGKRALSVPEQDSIDRALQIKMRKLDRLIAQAGQMASELTQYTAVSVSPIHAKFVFSRFQLFLPDPHSLVIVVVLGNGMVENTLCKLNHPADEADVQQLSNALNSVFSGQSELSAERWEMTGRLAGAGAAYLPLAASFMGEILQAQREVHVAGTSRLLSYPEYRDMDKMQSMLNYLADQQELSRLPLPDEQTPVQILIGPENAARELQEASVVMATYPIGQDMRGFIGVLGPTRMDYSRLVSRLSYFVGRLGDLLDK